MFALGQVIEADSAGTWYPAKVVEVNKKARKVKIHYQGWKKRYDEWLPVTSSRLRGDHDDAPEPAPKPRKAPARDRGTWRGCCTAVSRGGGGGVG